MVRSVLQFGVVAAALAGGCNSLFGIHEGKPRPICADTNPLEPLIDDMEDGDGFICNLDGRNGHWYSVGDTPNAELTPGMPFDPALISDGGRGTSRYAAHVKGSGFKNWGALMGFGFADAQGIPQPWNALGYGGIQFWLKSDAPVLVAFRTDETVPMSDGGHCADTAIARNCDNDFAFQITAPSNSWEEYKVPFTALTQTGGSAGWNLRLLLGVQFVVPPGAAFDVWVDDVRLYYCARPDCAPTCSDPAFTISCPATDHFPAACWPQGTDCTQVATWCSDPLMIDDMEDHDAAICRSSGRQGWWYAVGDDTGGHLTPEMDFVQTAIPGGSPSGYAARFTGSGFKDWGALMGLSLNSQSGRNLPYNAIFADGITFSMKSNVAVSVKMPIPETLPKSSYGGLCADGTPGCGEHFSFPITAPTSDWVKYEVPFSALSSTVGLAAWNPSHLLAIEFATPKDSTFDVWVDDVRFYTCSLPCLPTCTDPVLPVQCPASGGYPSRCWPEGTDCVVGCNYTNTISPLRDAPIATFSGGNSGADIKGQIFGLIDPEPVPTITDGALHITLNAPPTPVSQVHIVVDKFESCVNATASTGVQFSISGSFSGCTLVYFTEDSAHVHDNGHPMSPGSHGTGPVESHPTVAGLTAAQVGSVPKTVTVPFTDLVNGFPGTPLDKTKITGFGWAFLVDPLAGQGTTPCVADLTIDDVRFY